MVQQLSCHKQTSNLQNRRIKSPALSDKHRKSKMSPKKSSSWTYAHLLLRHFYFCILYIYVLGLSPFIIPRWTWTSLSSSPSTSSPLLHFFFISLPLSRNYSLINSKIPSYELELKKVSALCALSVIVVLIVQSIIVSNTYSRYMYTQLYWLYLCSYSIGIKVQYNRVPELKGHAQKFQNYWDFEEKFYIKDSRFWGGRHSLEIFLKGSQLGQIEVNFCLEMETYIEWRISL